MLQNARIFIMTGKNSITSQPPSCFILKNCRGAKDKASCTNSQASHLGQSSSSFPARGRPRPRPRTGTARALGSPAGLTPSSRPPGGTQACPKLKLCPENPMVQIQVHRGGDTHLLPNCLRVGFRKGPTSPALLTTSASTYDAGSAALRPSPAGTLLPALTSAFPDCSAALWGAS